LCDRKKLEFMELRTPGTLGIGCLSNCDVSSVPARFHPMVVRANPGQQRESDPNGRRLDAYAFNPRPCMVFR